MGRSRERGRANSDIIVSSTTDEVTASSGEYRAAAAAFLRSVRRHLFASLSLELNYQRRITALALLGKFVGVFGDHVLSNRARATHRAGAIGRPPRSATAESLGRNAVLCGEPLSPFESAALGGCLVDPYEANREVASRLLVQLGGHAGLTSPTTLARIVAMATSPLLKEVRPATPAYPKSLCFCSGGGACENLSPAT
jgi:hypothetical protein